MSDSNTPPWILKFISGKYQGGEFALEEGGEYVVGRSSECDMVLVEDMVSRAHATLSVMNGEVVLRDNNSTNGSFVNGERVSESVLNEGDRILFGTSIIKLLKGSSATGDFYEHTARPPRNTSTTVSPAVPKQTETGRSTVAGMMSGLLEEVPLPDLLQLFSTSRKTGVLRVQGAREARIFMREGRVIYCEISDSPELGPEKAAYRVITWTKGMFVLEPWEERDFDEEIQLSTEALMMEAMRMLDELQNHTSEIPSLDVVLKLKTPIEPQLSELDELHLDALQLVINHGMVEKLLNQTEREEGEIIRALDALIVQDYVEIDES